MSPAIFLTAFNTMLTGTIAASIAEMQPPVQRLPIIVTGIAFQGLGWILSLIYLPWYIGTVEVLQVVADWVGIFLWLFTFWLFAIALVANIPVMSPYKEGRFQVQMGFKLSWWGIIFPNVGFTIATGFIGNVLARMLSNGSARL
ncbi:putative Malic acid transport protein [Seiridium cardinale]